MKNYGGMLFTVGTAVMILGVGVPSMAQAGGGNDGWQNRTAGDRYEERRWIQDEDRYHDNEYPDYRDRNTADYRDRSDSRYDGAQHRNAESIPYYTDAYGDLDTVYADKDPYPNDRHNRYGSSGDGQVRSDDQIRQNIIDEFDEGMERVRVSVNHGVATLSGMVLNRETMLTAVENAYDGGARKVRNQLHIFRAEERPWIDLSDRKLAKAVREELTWSPYVDAEDIQVNARKGVVTLQGMVEDGAEMAAAVENAYEAGARRVKNQLRMVN